MLTCLCWAWLSVLTLCIWRHTAPTSPQQMCCLMSLEEHRAPPASGMHSSGIQLSGFYKVTLVLLPVAASYSHLAVSCQLCWPLAQVLQPAAHDAPASTPLSFPRVLERSRESTSLGSTLCICVARLISAFYRCYPFRKLLYHKTITLVNTNDNAALKKAGVFRIISTYFNAESTSENDWSNRD